MGGATQDSGRKVWIESMTYRYCGDVTIRVEWVDSESKYKARIGAYLVWIGPAPADTLAVDCPEAYDRAAHAALSFAMDDGEDVEGVEFADDLEGWLIRRKK